MILHLSTINYFNFDHITYVWYLSNTFLLSLIKNYYFSKVVYIILIESSIQKKNSIFTNYFAIYTFLKLFTPLLVTINNLTILINNNL